MEFNKMDIPAPTVLSGFLTGFRMEMPAPTVLSGFLTGFRMEVPTDKRYMNTGFGNV